jgi:hypothetical protein
VSYLPSLVEPDRLSEANSLTQVAVETADFGAPALAGWLMSATGAAFVVLADAASFAISLAVVSAISRAEPAPASRSDQTVVRGIADGLRFVARQPVLRLVSANGFFLCTAATALSVVQPLLFVRELRVGTGVYGVVVAVGALGGIAGGLAAIATIRRAGTLRALSVAGMLPVPSMVVMALLHDGWSIVLYTAAFACMSASTSVLGVAQVTYRQRVCPPALYARVSATMRFLMWAGMPAGGILAGMIAAAAGPRDALWAVAALVLLSAVPMPAIARRASSSDQEGQRPAVVQGDSA